MFTVSVLVGMVLVLVLAGWRMRWLARERPELLEISHPRLASIAVMALALALLLLGFF